jgi:hypothetical protein
MDKCLDEYALPKLNHEEINHANQFVTSKDIESVIKEYPNNEKPRTRGVHY